MRSIHSFSHSTRVALLLVFGFFGFIFTPCRQQAASATAPAAGLVYAIAVSGSDVYVGGSFTSIGNINANNIARYNTATNTWSALGGGVNNVVAAIAVNGGDVYVGGRFTNAVNPGGGNVPVTCVVRWNAASSVWAPLGASGVNQNGVNGDVSAIAVSGGFVYVGGDFNTARNSGSSTISVGSVARWNGSVWSALGAGSSASGNGVSSPGPPQVYAIAVSGTDVYVAGNFTRANNNNNASISTNCIAKWNSGTGVWSALGAGSGGGANGVNGDVLALAVSGSDLFAGGNFTASYNNTGAAVNAQHVARWNGTAWSTLGTGAGSGGNGTDGTVNTLAFLGGVLYVGGDFNNAYNGTGGGIGVNGVSANYIARWSGTAWSALGASSGSTGNGADMLVSALAPSGANVYVGGEFTAVHNSSGNKVNANMVAQWNGTTWSAFGGSTTGGAVTTVSAASFTGADIAAEAIGAAYGAELATGTQSATTNPLPTSLAGSTVRVKDAAGTERLSPLFFVSPTQINFQIPPGTVVGLATLTVTAGNGKTSVGGVQIASVSPAIFTANSNGQGVPAATLFRLKGNGAQSYESILQFNSATNQFVATPIDLGPTTDQVFLVLNGSGVRFRSALSAVTATIGGVAAEVTFAGPQGSLIGLDQINVRVPRNLAGRNSEVDVVVTVNGKAANTVKVRIQ
jgi:uncharacterized protein (TIGR03437 family)